MTKTPRRIVIDARRIRESTGRYSRELLRELQDIDDETEYHVVIHEKDHEVWQPHTSNFHLHVVPYDHYTFGEQLGFAWFLYRLKPALVHFTMPQQPLLYFGRRVTTIHDLTLVKFQNIRGNKAIYVAKQLIFKKLLKCVAKRSKKIITPSNATKKDLMDFAGTKESKIVVTYEAAASITALKPHEVTRLKDTQFLFYVGNAFPYKNLDALVEAYKLLQKDYPKLRLALAGKKEEFYEQLQEDYKNLDGFHVLGFVSDNELVWLFKNAAAYVFPSKSEGFGLPGMDAMQHGVPLVSSNATSLPEIYADAARYFDPNSSKDMARAIDEVLRDKKLREKLIKEGHSRLQDFSWRRLAEQTKEVYEKASRK